MNMWFLLQWKISSSNASFSILVFSDWDECLYYPMTYPPTFWRFSKLTWHTCGNAFIFCPSWGPPSLSCALPAPTPPPTHYSMVCSVDPTADSVSYCSAHHFHIILCWRFLLEFIYSWVLGRLISFLTLPSSVRPEALFYSEVRIITLKTSIFQNFHSSFLELNGKSTNII